MPIRRTVGDLTAKELTPVVIAILLEGWGAETPAAADSDGEDNGVFSLAGGWNFAAPRDDDAPMPSGILPIDEPIVRVWRRHEAFLRAEAARLGIAPSFKANGMLLFFGEYSAVPYPRDPDDSDSSTVLQ